jgi:ATP-binding cassette subfamily B (MDR/TAP) protein 1
MLFYKNLLGHPARQLTEDHLEKQHWTRHKTSSQGEDIQPDVNIETEKTLSASKAYFRLWRYASPLDWLLRTVGVFAALGGGTAYPLMTIIFGSLVNDFNAIALGLESPSQFRHRVNHNTLWFVYLFVGKFGLLYIADFFFCFTATRIARRIRIQYLNKVIHQPISYFDRHTPGSIAASLSTDTNIIEVGLADKVVTVCQGVGMIISAFIIALTKSWKMTLVVGTSIPYIVITTMILGSIDSAFETKRREKYSEASKISEEALSSISTVTALGAKDKIVEMFSVPLLAASRLTIKIGPVQASMYGNMFFAMQSTYALALFYGNKLFSDGEIKDGGTVMV